MDPELNDLEAKFFETGELPEGLAEHHENIQADPDSPEVTPAAPAIQAPATQDQPAAPQANQADQALQNLNARLQQLTQYSAQLEQAIKQLQQPPAPKEPEAPNPEEDPLGHMVHKITALEKQIASLTGSMTTQQQQQVAQGQLQNFVSAVGQQRDSFMAKTPDYADAYNHLRTIRAQDMRDMGVPEHQIPKMLANEEMTVAATAMQQGKNPAQMLYDISKRYGYKPAAPPPPADTKLATLQKGQQAAGKMQAAGKAEIPSFDSLKDMGNDDLQAIVESDDLWNKVVGKVVGGTSIH